MRFATLRWGSYLTSVFIRYRTVVPSVVFGLSFLMFGGCQSTHSMAAHALGWIPWSHRSEDATESIPSSEKTVKSRGLALSLRLDPIPVKLSETRRVEATLQLKNISSRFNHLEFPTTQRFDLLLRDQAGKLIAQWSEDQVFEAVPGYVGINPGEHLEYHAAFATRDLQPGKRYIATVIFPNRNDLKVELAFVPEK